MHALSVMDHMLVTRGAMLVILMKASWVINLYVRNLLESATAHCMKVRDALGILNCTWKCSYALAALGTIPKTCPSCRVLFVHSLNQNQPRNPKIVYLEIYYY